MKKKKACSHTAVKVFLCQYEWNVWSFLVEAELLHASVTVTTILSVMMMNSPVITSTHNHSISCKTKHFIFNHFPASYLMSCVHRYQVL